MKSALVACTSGVLFLKICVIYMQGRCISEYVVKLHPQCMKHNSYINNQIICISGNDLFNVLVNADLVSKVS